MVPENEARTSVGQKVVSTTMQTERSSFALKMHQSDKEESDWNHMLGLLSERHDRDSLDKWNTASFVHLKQNEAESQESSVEV